MTRTASVAMIAQATVLVALGAWLLFAPDAFYAVVPGVAESGPLNRHLMRDLGATYLTFALATGWALASSAAARIVLVAIAAFFAIHAALHAFAEASSGSAALFTLEAPGVYGLALATAFVAVLVYSRPRRPPGQEA